MSWLPAITGYQAGQAPDPLLLFAVMRESGIHIDVVDPYPFPANPFVRSNQLYRDLDPARAADVIIRSKKKYDLIVSVFKGLALFPLLLRQFSASPISLLSGMLT